MNARLIEFAQKTVAFVVLVFLFVGATAIAQSVEGLTPQQVAKLKSVGEVVISGDGNQIAYTLQIQADPFEENKTASYHLYVLNSQTGTSAPIFTGSSVSSVQFRPEHNTLTFLAKNNGDETTSLYEIATNGGEAQKIYSFKTSILNYDWASDGNHIAFMAKEPVEKKEPILPYQPEIYEENLVQRRGYITNVAKTGHGFHRVQVAGSIYQMRWNPDRQRLAIAIAPTPLIDDYYMKQQVLIIDHHGEKVSGRVDHEGKLGEIAWSPDGERLAMLAGANVNDPVAGRLFVVPANGGAPKNLKPGYQGKFEHFQWVDNNTIHFVTSIGVWSTYGRINADGSGINTIVDTGGPVLHRFSRSKNGIVAFEVDSPTHPDEVYVMGKKDKFPRRMTNSNPWLKEAGLGRQEVVTWQARDGMELQGLLIYPLSYETGEQYPVITVVHGGPESHYDNGWITSYSQPGQMSAANNFAVFYPNYRGSTGRGLEFTMSSQGDQAGAEFDDIVDGVDHLIASGIADRNKIGVTGGSYGGYATGWLSTRYTDRFAAGVMFVGISDNISKWGTSDIPEELYLVHNRMRIWEDWFFWLKRSPVYHAGKADTPLLIMAGKEDTRVDPGQSYELYRHIKTRTDTPVRLVLYPGEGHGNAHATARFDYSLRMMRWFEQYLKGGQQQPGSELELEEVGIGN